MKSREEYKRDYKRGRVPLHETIGFWIFVIFIIGIAAAAILYLDKLI